MNERVVPPSVVAIEDVSVVPDHRYLGPNLGEMSGPKLDPDVSERVAPPNVVAIDDVAVVPDHRYLGPELDTKL